MSIPEPRSGAGPAPAQHLNTKVVGISIDAAVGIGSIFGLILGLLILAVTVFYVIKGEGRILPARQPVQQ